MIPKDSVMMLSFVNTQLRDNYSSLKDLCKAFDTDEEYIKNKLSSIDYYYDEELNQFK